jgi:hypothetical protein
MMTFSLSAARTDSHGSVASAKDTHLIIDTSMAGRMDAWTHSTLWNYF